MYLARGRQRWVSIHIYNNIQDSGVASFLLRGTGPECPRSTSFRHEGNVLWSCGYIRRHQGGTYDTGGLMRNKKFVSVDSPWNCKKHVRRWSTCRPIIPALLSRTRSEAAV
jgi:hypothetical protein